MIAKTFDPSFSFRASAEWVVIDETISILQQRS